MGHHCTRFLDPSLILQLSYRELTDQIPHSVNIQSNNKLNLHKNMNDGWLYKAKVKRNTFVH